MPKKTIMKEIPLEDLKELVERAQTRLEERIDSIRNLEVQLGNKGAKIARLATYTKICIIIIGAIIATRVVADRIWEPVGQEKGSRPPVEVVYTVLSVAIAIIGGLDSAFKPGEVATEINFMKVKCETTVNEVEELWAKEVERYGVSMEALNHTDPLLAKLDHHLNETKTRLAQLGVHLREKILVEKEHRDKIVN